VTDIAGLIKGASEGAGLGNAFLSHIAAVDGIFHLIRAFDSDEVIHVDDSVDPIRDLETIQGELCLKDKETLSKTLEKEKDRVRKEKGLARAAEPVLAEAFLSAYETCTRLIENNTPVQTHEDFSMAEVEIIKDWGLSELQLLGSGVFVFVKHYLLMSHVASLCVTVTTKPVIYVVNLSSKNFIRKGSKWLPKINDWVKSHGGGQIMPISCDFEQQLYDLKDDPEAQKGKFTLYDTTNEERSCIVARVMSSNSETFLSLFSCSLFGAVQGRSYCSWTQGSPG
jgi:ribosome-binding ATPase YchF (GTP1/OBG family)